MKKYEIRSATKEVKYKDRFTIKEDVVVGDYMDEEYSNTESSFNTLEEAREELKKYKTSIAKLSGGSGTYYLVEEFYIEEVEYKEDEFGDIERIQGEIFDTSKMAIEVIEIPSYEVIATFDNWKDAEEFYNNDEREVKILV